MSDTALEKPVVVTIEQIAKWLGVSSSTARRYAKKGLLPKPVISGDRVVARWRRVDLLDWAGLDDKS